MTGVGKATASATRHSRRVWRVHTLRLVAALALVAGACGSGAGEIEQGPPQGASAEERLGEQPSDFQLERLGDGVVTVSEYEESVRANVDCLRDAGIEVNEPTWNADSTEITFGYRWTTPGGILEEERSRLDVGFDESAVECWITYEAFVADRWHSQDIPVGNERATMLESLVLCIREANGVIRDSPDYSDVAALIQDEAASLTELGV